MKMKLGITLLVVLFLVGMLPVFSAPLEHDLANDSGNYDTNSISNPQSNRPEYTLSDHQLDGVLNPLEIEQRGYLSTGNESVRNDLTPSVENFLTIDTTHDWVGSVASAEIYDLEKLYALNGTFDDGFPGANLYPNGSAAYHPLGWQANSTDTATYPDDKQLAEFDTSTRNYVSVESQGGKVGQNEYGHAAGTKIVWIQNVQNSPYTEDFLLNFNYYYDRGPLDKNAALPISGNCSLALIIDGTNVWNMSLSLLSERGLWLNTGDITLHISGVPSSFTFELGLVIDETMKLDYKTADYDNDSIVDCIEHSAYITAYLDDISFKALTPPSPESVELTLNAGAGSSGVTGTPDYGTAEVSNGSYWESETLAISFSSNTSISFTYDVNLLSHRFSNSTWTNEVTSEGTGLHTVA